MFKFFRNVMVPPYHFGTLIALCILSAFYSFVIIQSQDGGGEVVTEQCTVLVDEEKSEVVANCKTFGAFKLNNTHALEYLFDSSMNTIACTKRIGGVMTGGVSCDWNTENKEK